MRKIITLMVVLLFSTSIYAQFSRQVDLQTDQSPFSQMQSNTKSGPQNTDGSVWSQINTPFSTTDIYGNAVNVSDTLAAGKCVVVCFSATWSTPDYNFHQSKNLKAIHDQLDSLVCVLWVEIDNSTTISDIYGTGSSTQGDFTHYNDNTAVPYRIIDCSSCENMVDPTGYIPEVAFISPNGYYCFIYGESWGVTINMTNAQAVSNIQALINSYPRSGIAPVSVEINGPDIVFAGNTATFTVDYVSVDNVTGISWSAPGSNNSTGTGSSINVSYSTSGTYTLSVSVTNTSGTTTATKSITVNDAWNWGDTMDYTNGGTYMSSIGYSGSGEISWGVKYPTSLLSGRNYITAVNAYVVNSGQYDLRIYQGGENTPATLIYQNSYYVTNTDEWADFDIPGGVAISSNQNLWVTLHCNGVSYPAAYCPYVGDPNTRLIYDNSSSWVEIQTLASSLNDVTWMIKTITSSTAPVVIPTVSISGPASVQPGVPATFTASVTNDNNSTITWTLQGATPSTATGTSVTATWNSLGTYDVIATATNAYGTSSDTMQVTVSYSTIFSYCGDIPLWAMVTVGDYYYWGMMIPSYELTSFGALNAVQLYVGQSGDYNLLLYQGDSTAPGTLVYSQNYYFGTATDQYETCTLTTPYTVDPTQNLWVIIYSEYAPICSYSGYPNGTWIYFENTWLNGEAIYYDGNYFSWMLRCVFNSEPRVTINGPASVAAGTPATFTATTIPQTVHVSWTLQGATPSTASGDTVTATWSNAGTYNVIASAVIDGTPVADTLVVTVIPSYPVTISCTGTGGGESQRTYEYDGNRCGQTDHYAMGFYASYDFIADEGSDLTHLYVNNVDRINDVYTNWYSGTSVSTFEFQVFENTTINAVFDARVYHVDATSSDATMGYVTGGGNYFYDSIATITAVPMPHYQFSYWDIIYYGDSIMWPENPIVFNVFDDISIVAHFEPEVYTITVAPNNVTAGAVTGGGTFEYLEPVSLTATAYSGYRFLMWSNGSTYNPYTFPATEDLDLVAVFVEDNDTTHYFSITVNVNDASMGTATGGGVFTMGDVATLEATAYDGYHFAQWQDGNNDNPRQVTVLGDATFTAYFAPNQGVTYTLTATAADESMGYVTGGGSYADGAVATLTAIPYEGYEFDHWQDNETVNPREVTVTADAEYVAYFRPLDGVETVDSQVGLRIYPNPATDVATIALSGISGSVSLKVVDLNGRTVAVRAFECDGGCMTAVDVEGLVPGAYFVQVVSNDAVIVKKLIVR